MHVTAGRNRTSRNGQLDLTRRDGPGRATSTRTMRRCPWRLGYGSPPPLLPGASRGRESLREFLFGSTRRAALRAKLSSICTEAAWIGHSTLLGFSGGPLSAICSTYVGRGCVSTEQNRARRLRCCRSKHPQQTGVLLHIRSTEDACAMRHSEIAATRARARRIDIFCRCIARQYLCSSHARRRGSNRDS